nr:unnamed protein product [Spirometra erinaceieuropaei]
MDKAAYASLLDLPSSAADLGPAADQPIRGKTSLEVVLEEEKKKKNKDNLACPLGYASSDVICDDVHREFVYSDSELALHPPGPGVKKESRIPEAEGNADDWRGENLHPGVPLARISYRKKKGVVRTPIGGLSPHRLPSLHLTLRVGPAHLPRGPP